MKRKIINKFYEWLFHNGIRKQIMGIVIFTLLVPTLTIGAMLSFILLKTTYQHSEDQMVSDNLRVRSILLDCFLDINIISNDLISDTDLQELLSADLSGVENIPVYLNSYTRIKNYHDSKSFISEITIYSTNPTIEDARNIKQASSEVIDQYFSLVDYPGEAVWCTSYDSAELSLVRSIPLRFTDSKAILVITISNNYLKNRIKNNQLYTALELNQGPLFYATTRSDQGTAQFFPIDYSKPMYSEHALYNYHGSKVFGCTSSLKIPNSDDMLYIGTLDFTLLNTMLKLFFLSGAIIVSSFIVALFGIVLYTKALERRIDILRAATHQASNGNYNIMDTFEGEDELSETFRDIKHMIQTVQETEARIYEEEIRKQKYENVQREMEFKLLTSQINPHFIYNTLETIRMLALSNGDVQVSNTVRILGKSLHYVLDNTISTKASIEKELNHIVNYLQIQKLRFDDRFDYNIYIPDNIDPSEYQILPLLLQPLVENVITHGIEGIDYKCMIQITLTIISENTLVIDIIDDGIGMSDEALERLNQNLKNPVLESQNSIALLNIAKRIRLFYGESYYLRIMHNLPRGTHVQLSIPLLPFE